LAGKPRLICNPINNPIVPGRNDGKVSVERTKLAGMTDHLVIHAAHPFLMRNRMAIRQTIQFLHAGCFEGHQSFSAFADGKTS
jgi:hypothetical protein